MEEPNRQRPVLIASLPFANRGFSLHALRYAKRLRQSGVIFQAASNPGLTNYLFRPGLSYSVPLALSRNSMRVNPSNPCAIAD
jgi:hypothetical protein